MQNCQLQPMQTCNTATNLPRFQFYKLQFTCIPSVHLLRPQTVMPPSACSMFAFLQLKKHA